MSTREIVLDGGSPWGFRMHGGSDVGQPLRISRVNPGSKAAQSGAREGDIISSINGQSTRNFTNSDAHALLRNAGQTLQLGLNEECCGSPNRRSHRNLQQEAKLDSVKRSTSNKTPTTTRTTPASLNGAADFNFNSQFPVTGDQRGVKESPTVSISDSKGQRPRRRQCTTQLDLPGDSYSIAEAHNASKGGDSKSRRRRRSRGNRRKCLVGNGSDVSGNEPLVGEQEREISTAATMSDMAAKVREHNARRQESSEVDSLEEVVNKEIKQEVTFRNIQFKKLNVLSFDVNKGNVDELIVEKKSPVDCSFVFGEMDRKEGGSANVTSFAARKRRIVVATTNTNIAEVESNEEDFLYQKKVQRAAVNWSDRTEFNFERNASESNNSGTKITQSLAKRCITVQENESAHESAVEVRHEAEDEDSVILLHEKEVTESCTQTICIENTGKEVNGGKNECEEAATEGIFEDVVTENKMSLIDAKDRAEFLVSEITNEMMNAGVNKQSNENVNSLVGKTVDVSVIETGRNNNEETHISKIDTEAETKNIEALSTGRTSPQSDNDGSCMQITHLAQGTQEQEQEQVKEFGSSFRNVKTKCCVVATEGLTVGEHTEEIREASNTTCCHDTVSDLALTTANIPHIFGEQICNTGNCAHRTVEYQLESAPKDANRMARDEHLLVGELYSRNAVECENDRSVASDSFKATGNNSQSDLLVRSDACKDTDGVCPGTNTATANEKVVRIPEMSEKGYQFRTEREEKKGGSVPNESPPECRAVVMEVGEEDVWEKAEELCAEETVSEDNRLSSGDGTRSCMTDIPASGKNSELSQEEKELLDPHPLIGAEDEETLRRFLHSLNLADYSKEAIRYRNAGNTIEEVYATRKGKRRAPLETYPSQQRALEVIVEENSSDYSDGEKRLEEAGSLREKQGKAWEEAIYIPGTNQIVFISNGCEESRVRTRSMYYSERKVVAHGTENEESSALVYRRAENDSRSMRPRIIPEDAGTDVFSKNMEIALENVDGIEECDSEDGREELEVRIELAESSEDEEDIKSTWKKGRARERQDTVDIVYIEEDSGSTSSGSCVATKRSGDIADEEEDPDVLYEGIEFPVVEMPQAKEASLETSPVSAIYENVEFHRNTETGTSKRKSDIPPDLQESPPYSVTNEFSADIYEEIEFVGDGGSNATNTELNLSTPVLCDEVNPAHLLDSSNTNFVINSRPIDNNNNNNNNKHVPKRNDDDNTAARYFKITESDYSSYIEREQVATLDNRKGADCLLQVEPTSQLENRIQADSVTDIMNTHAKASHESTRNINPVIVSEVQSLREVEKTDFPKTSNVHLQRTNSKTIDIVKRILSLIPQGETMDNNHLDSIISQVTSENGETESLADSVPGRSARYAASQQDRNEETCGSKCHTESGGDMFFESRPPPDGIEYDSNPKTVESDLDSKSAPVTPGSETTGKYHECPPNGNDRALQSLGQIESGMKTVNEGEPVSGTETVQCNADLQDISPGIEIHIEEGQPHNISGEFGNVRDEEDGFDELDSITPTNRSRPGSSSSDAGSHGTAVYCPGRFSPQSSDADISSYAEDTVAESRPLHKVNICNRLSKSRSHENISKPKKYLSPTFRKVTESPSKVPSSPKTLKDLSIDRVVSLPYGVDMLNVLGISVPLGNPERTEDSSKVDVNSLLQGATKRFQFLNSPSVFGEYKCMGKSPLSASLPDVSSMKQEVLIRDIVITIPLPPPVASPPSLPESHWLGMPTKEDPNVLVCLSPSQRRSYQQGEAPTPEEAENLLDLHRKFIQRRGYHENPPPASRRALGTFLPDNLLGDDMDCGELPSVAGKYSESEETALASKPVPSPRFRTVLTSLDSKILCKGKTRAQMKEKTVNEDKEEHGGGDEEREGSRGSSRLLAILRASSEPQEIQAKHLSPPSSCSPPPLPPLPDAYQHQAAMLGCRPTSFCCTSAYSDFDFLLQHGPPRSPSCDSNLQSPSSPCFSFLERTGSRKERAPSWYGQSMADGNSSERLNVKSLSDWLQLVRRGGSSKDSTPCVSTQSSPGPIRRVTKDSSPKPYVDLKGHQRLKQEILERRFSLPEGQSELTCQQDQKLIKPPLLPTSARDDERHDQQLKLLQQRQQRVRNHSNSNRAELIQEKRPPLPQQQSRQRQTDRELQLSPAREESTALEETLHVERRFDADNYRISKKGDIAIINSNATTREQSILRGTELQAEKNSRLSRVSQRPKSVPPPTESLVTGGEIFRQQMYLEYMNKVAERAERRRHKVIRLSSISREDTTVSETQDASATTVHHLENEFMGKVRERMDKLGLKYDEESDDGTDSCYVITGGGETHGVGSGSTSVSQLPKHLQEFLLIAGGTGTDSDVNSDVDGIWSPSVKPSADIAEDSNVINNQEKKKAGDAPPVVWTPKSAGASPTTERKEFRPINFESPPLPRKNLNPAALSAPFRPADDLQLSVTQEPTPTTTFSSIFPPWQQQQFRDDSTLNVGSNLQSPTDDKSVASSAITSTLDRRLVQSQSAPPSGLSALAAGGSSNTRLPRAQNPTITLLQKAREGQLSRGALYLDHKMNSKEEEKPYTSPNEILYTVKKEYESEGENEQRKKTVHLGPRKFEGIGPMTKEGIPIVLRSEVKDANQAKWYKRMYDSLHRTGKDDEYVTIRYKPRRGHYPYTSPGGYLSEPEPSLYDSDIGYSAKYATLDRRRIKNKENDFTTSTLPRSRYVPHPASIKYATEIYKNQPGRIEDYEPGHSSISDKETKQWWDEVLDIFDGQTTAEPRTTPSTPSSKPFMTHALKESGYESDSTLVFKRRDENMQSQLSPAEQKLAYKTIQKGGEVPLHGLRKPAPERPKESPHRYVESEVTIHYRSPVRSEAKEVLSEEELARRQAEAMRRIYQEERRRKYLQELQDMHSRRHTDNFTPSQKSPIPLNRYDDFLDDVGKKGKPRDRTPEPKLVARALYSFVGQTSRELSFRRGDIIFVRRQIDKNWYEGEHNAMIGLFPFNYVEIIPYDGIRTIPKRPSEGQARAKFTFIAQTHLELSLVKGELVVLTRRVDDNWFEGRIGNRKGIFPVSYVEILSEPGEKPVPPVAPSSKPAVLPASHTILMNGSGIKQSMGQHSYQPSSYYSQNKMTSSYTSSNSYATLPRQSQTLKQPLAPVNQTLHIDTHSEPVPYRALYNYKPQNEDELELCEGDTVYVMEKCDDGWYVGSSQRTGYFGTFPGNYVERI